MGKAVRVWTSPDVGVNLIGMAETSAESQEPGLLRGPGSPTSAGGDPGTGAAVNERRFLFGPRVFYGWYMVVCGWIALTLGYGILFSAPLIFFESWSDTFGWGRGTISNAFSLSLLAVALASPGAGKITDKYGSQPVMLFGGVMLGVGVFLLRWISEPWELYAAMMIAALGFAFCVAVPVNVLIARWFERRRSLAIAITYTGIGAGGTDHHSLGHSLYRAVRVADHHQHIGHHRVGPANSHKHIRCPQRSAVHGSAPRRRPGSCSRP